MTSALTVSVVNGIIVSMLDVSDVILQINDHCGNYTTNPNNPGQQVRAVNSAVNKVFQKLGGPQDKFTFYYYSDTMFYDVPVNYKEFIGISYVNPDNNIAQNLWSYRSYIDITKQTGQGAAQLVSNTTVNSGALQLVMSGVNLFTGATIDSFDDVLWTADDDASDIEFDYNVKVQGTASQKFTITDSLGEAVVFRDDLNLSVLDLHQRVGAWRVYSFLPSVELLSIKMRYETDPTNYYEISIDKAANGADFVIDEWNLLGFSTLDKTVVGDPDENNITKISFIYELGPDFPASVENFRLDWLYTSFPDQIEVVFYSKYKGENLGGDPITTISASTDKIDVPDDDWVELISLYGALYIFPQLRGDKDFMAMYKSETAEMIKLWGRQHPRFRNANEYQQTRLRR